MLQKNRILIKKRLYYSLNATENKQKVIFTDYSRRIQNVTFERNIIVFGLCDFLSKIKIGGTTILSNYKLLDKKKSIGRYLQIEADLALNPTNESINLMSICVFKKSLNKDSIYE